MAKVLLQAIGSSLEAFLRAEESVANAEAMEKLERELDEWRGSEMWKTGAAVRSLRPEHWKK